MARLDIVWRPIAAPRHPDPKAARTPLSGAGLALSRRHAGAVSRPVTGANRCKVEAKLIDVLLKPSGIQDESADSTPYVLGNRFLAIWIGARPRFAELDVKTGCTGPLLRQLTL